MPQNDQFRRFNFLNKQIFDSNYTSIDAEWQEKFFEMNFRFLTDVVLALLTNNAPKNRRPDFVDPVASEKIVFSIDSEFDQICW